MSEIEISEEELKEKSAVKGPYYCYIVYDKFGNTYNGFTNNLERRIKQHNSILKGGCIFDNIVKEKAVKFDTHEEAFREVKNLSRVGIDISNVETEFINEKYILVRGVY